MSDRVLVAGAPGALALPLARRLRRAVRSHALLLDEIDLRAGQGGRETDAELIESWTRSSRTLSTAREWIADDPPGTLVLWSCSPTPGVGTATPFARPHPCPQATGVRKSVCLCL